MPTSSDREPSQSRAGTHSTKPAAESADQKETRVGDILHQILAASERVTGSSGEDPCRAGLLAVAAKYSAEEFCQEPVLLELVQVMTRRIHRLPPARLAALEKSVVASLYEDQNSLGRLQQLWTTLTGRTSHAE